MKLPDKNIVDRSEWKEYSFDEIAYNINEKVDPTNTDLEIYVGLEHLDSESIHIRRFGKRSDVIGAKLRVYPGDIIFGRRRAYQRKAAIANFDGFCSAHALVLRAKEEAILPMLFPFFLHSDTFMNRAIDISVGSLSPTINWGTLKKEKFLLPPKDQQEKIADLLWSADKLIENYSNQLDILILMYKSFLKNELFSTQGRGEPVTHYGKIVRGVSYKPKELLNKESENSCLILRANNIKNSLLNFNDVKILPSKKIKSEQYLRKDDFVICMANGSKELVGKAAQFDNYRFPASVGSFCAILRPNSVESSKILLHYFNSLYYRFIIKRLTSGSNINNLKPSDFNSMKIKVKNRSSINQSIIKLEKIRNSITMVRASRNNSILQLKTINNSIF